MVDFTLYLTIDATRAPCGAAGVDAWVCGRAKVQARGIPGYLATMVCEKVEILDHTRVLMGIHPEHGTKVETHEFVHIRQYEDLNLLGAVIGGIVAFWSWRLGLVLWCSSGCLWLLPNFLTGWIRYGDAYYGAEHERSAYAQTR